MSDQKDKKWYKRQWTYIIGGILLGHFFDFIFNWGIWQFIFNHSMSAITLPLIVYYLSIIIILALLILCKVLIKKNNSINTNGNARIDVEYRDRIEQLNGNINAYGLNWEWDTRFDNEGRPFVMGVKMLCPTCKLELIPDDEVKPYGFDEYSITGKLVLRCEDCGKVRYRSETVGELRDAICDKGQRYIEREIRNIRP